MAGVPDKLMGKLNARKEQNAFRSLSKEEIGIDFSSNDYMGIAGSASVFNDTHQYLIEKNIKVNGATGSRLLSGNHLLYREIEEEIGSFHRAEAALVFNSGYDANIGFFSSVPQKGDIVLYDEFIHASIRDGIGMSNARSYKFKHNDINDLSALLERVRSDNGEQDVFVVTESVFSMDGDTPDLSAFTAFCEEQKLHLIIDEAHAVGVFGEKGCGLIQEQGLENKVFARIITFGKALGCHGAAVLGSAELKEYLVNFARSFIYTTALPPHSLAAIHTAYAFLSSEEGEQRRRKLEENIRYFWEQLEKLKLVPEFVESTSAIHCCVIGGNEKVKRIAMKMQEAGFDVKPILSPTVPLGMERLRFCLHVYNSKEEIKEILLLLKELIEER
ncbi:aminotransferase class I/II-fold pyridoxal phosphate-dependent enzyme [Leptobacterium flavescens]|uniref:Aminotransferase class I/II-fold pyridoxal phosphate-dependent enzyme n=1 Tax=Leptobacterium flavescens TaxID=472055 RepID=A0A6P0UVR1_9FLAO|nr:8-amino-7-oxononanoate synthase [Leptobacterium flavescens]NER14506.1 aminotransferase class I/II-fold pyridoxal phosphate-dependent enzyme [Leptobacterium flavescens]